MKHGANIYKYASKLKCNEDEIVDFSSNINFYHPSIKLKSTNKIIVKYADTSYSKLKKTISKKYNILKSQIALYNGATSAIYELLKYTKEDRVYLYAPLYGEYEKASKETNKKIIKINRFKDIYKKPKKGSIVIFVNPATPDGKYYDLKKLFKLWNKQSCTIILDESFLEFQDLESFRDEISSNKKLYIVQSFSKFNSCAGVRIGAIFSHSKNIKKLKTPIWNLSSFDVEFLNIRLKDKKFIKKSKKLHYKNKLELEKILKDSNHILKVYESDSNFFLTKVKNKNKLFKQLLKQRILVRTCGSFDYLSDRYLRFAVKNSISHKKLQKALKVLSI